MTLRLPCRTFPTFRGTSSRQGSVDSSNPLSQDDFIILISRHERRVRGFVTTLVRQRGDVDEIVQQTCLTAWRKYQEFTRKDETLDRDFVRWLCTIARFESLGFLRKNRGSKMLFDSELVGKLADLQLQDERLEDRREALQHCIDKLAESQKELVRRYYRADESAAEIADADGVTRQAIFKRLRAIRLVLLECVRRSVEPNGAPG